MPSRLSDLKRASKVIDVCFKEGLGHFIDKFGLKWHLPFFKRLTFSKPEKPESVPMRIRKTMEELGGAYVKLGQLLSIRPDLIPIEYCEEFKHLRDETAPMQFLKAKKIIEQELKQPLNKTFSYFEKYPLGSASIAQVHKAKLHSGKNAVVKVQRLGIEKEFAEDIDILYYLAHKIEKHINAKTFSPVLIVQEFERYTKNELNFICEAKNIDKFYQSFRDSNTVIIPKVDWMLTTQKILCMDYLDGKKLSDIKKLSPNDKKIISKRIMDCGLKQLFELGFFHADMHPGNIIIMPNNKIGLLDFGIVGTLSQERLAQLMIAYAGIINKDTNQIIDSLISISPPSAETELDAFKEDINCILTEWHMGAQNKIRITQIAYILFETCIKHKLKIPKDLIVFGKAAMTVEGTCVEVYPDFNFTEYSKPKIAQLLQKQNTTRKIARQLLQKTAAFGENVAALPGAAVSLINKLQKEPLKLGIDNTDVRHLGLDISTSSNRLSYSMLIASLIIAGSLLINIGPAYKNYSLISIITFFLAGIMLVPLLVSVMREGTKKYDAHGN